MKWNFEKLIKRSMKIGHLSALSAAIVVDDKTVWSNGYGLYDREKNLKADEKTIYQMSSLTKSITATAAMHLYEKGYFELDEDINNHLPFSLRNPNFPDVPITYRMLLSHTSSLAPEEGDLFASTFLPLEEKDVLENYYLRVIPDNLKIDSYPDPFLKEYLVPGGFYYRPLVWNKYPPGEIMVYSNIAYGVLGYLIELLTKQHLEEYCRKNIFNPLDMKDSSFNTDNLDRNRLAVAYEYRSGKYFPLIPYTFLDYPAVGLRTNVCDLSHFLIAHMNGGVYNGNRILNEETVKEMHTIQCQNTSHVFDYGLGFQLKGRSTTTKFVFNTGGFWGYYVKMKFSPYDKIGFIICMNVNPFVTKKIREILRKRISHALIEELLLRKAFLNY